MNIDKQMTCPNDIRQLITSRSLKFVVRASNWIAVLISRNFRLFLNILVNASRVNNVKVTGDASPPSPIGLIEKCYQYWFRRPSSIITSLDNRQLRTMNIHRAALAHSWSCNLGAWMTNRKCAILLAAGASNKVIINSILLERSLRTSLALLIASMSLRPGSGDLFNSCINSFLLTWSVDDFIESKPPDFSGSR